MFTNLTPWLCFIEEPNNNDGGNETQEVEEVAKASSNGETDPESTEDVPKPEDELPEWAKKERAELREEAGKWRTKLRAAEKQLREAKTQEDIDSAVSDLTSTVETLNREILIRDAAEAVGLPAELRPFIKGETKEEVEASAKTLAKYAPSTNEAVNLAGGLNPNDSGSANPSVEELAKKYSRFRKE